MDDNRNNSTDNRVIGLISEEEIYCSTNLSLFIFSEMGRINK